jgi:phytoene dehydrogenase-like protein
MGDFDAVMAGGMPNGLAAALRLAEVGWSVYLAEANPDLPRRWPLGPDGGVHPARLPPRPWGGVSGPGDGVTRDADRDLAALGLRFRHAPLPAAHPLPGGRAIALGRSAA